MITEVYRLAATNSDLLSAGTSRLASIPYNGTLILEMQADVCDGSNQFAISVQLPDGSTPLNEVPLPAGVTANCLNANEKYQVSFGVPQGGHVTVNCAETGTAVMILRATLIR